MPAWMNEGLATVFEPGGLEAEPATPVGTTGPGLSKLSSNFASLPKRDAEVAYAAATRAVRRLIDQRGVATVVALLEDLKRGMPFPESFERRIGMRYEEFADR